MRWTGRGRGFNKARASYVSYQRYQQQQWRHFVDVALPQVGGLTRIIHGTGCLSGSLSGLAKATWKGGVPDKECASRQAESISSIGCLDLGQSGGKHGKWLEAAQNEPGPSANTQQPIDEA